MDLGYNYMPQRGGGGRDRGGEDDMSGEEREWRAMLIVSFTRKMPTHLYENSNDRLEVLEALINGPFPQFRQKQKLHPLDPAPALRGQHLSLNTTNGTFTVRLVYVCYRQITARAFNFPTS
jgi:hypothetical protein